MVWTTTYGKDVTTSTGPVEPVFCFITMPGVHHESSHSVEPTFDYNSASIDKI
jgi:hypothetical protein